jgi:hypothetical protein
VIIEGGDTWRTIFFEERFFPVSRSEKRREAYRSPQSLSLLPSMIMILPKSRAPKTWMQHVFEYQSLELSIQSRTVLYSTSIHISSVLYGRHISVE